MASCLLRVVCVAVSVVFLGACGGDSDRTLSAPTQAPAAGASTGSGTAPTTGTTGTGTTGTGTGTTGTGTTGTGTTGTGTTGTGTTGTGTTGTGTTGTGTTGTGTTGTGTTGTGTTGAGTSSSTGVKAVEITAGGLNVRTGPSTSYARIGVAHQGEVYAAFEEQGTWFRIWFDGRAAWLSANYTQGSSEPVKVVTASSLNVRSGPGTNYQAIGQVPRDSLVVVASTNGNWREISFAGRSAWVYATYLTDATTASLAATQVAAATATGTGATTTTTTTGTGTTSTGTTTTTTTTSSSNPQGLPSSTRGFLQLPASGPGFYAYYSASRRWGRDYFVYGIMRVGSDWASTGKPRIGIGDLSLENGGNISGHVSHEKGVDVDVRPVRTSGESGVTIHSSSYDRAGTQTLVNLFRQHNPVTMIFFNDASVSGVQNWPNHDDHLHIRVTER